MSNPDLQQQVMDAQLAFRSAEAAYENRKADLQSQLLNQEAGVATLESQSTPGEPRRSPPTKSSTRRS